MESKPVLYHWDGQSGRATGTIKLKGLWGRYIMDRPLTASHAAREFIYEHVRKKKYPERPSRLNSVFLCPNKESAKVFGDMKAKGSLKNRGPGHFDLTLYEVEIIDVTAKSFTANYGRMAQKQSNYEEVVAFAEDYWKAIDVPPQLQEIVIESDIRILKKARI